MSRVAKAPVALPKGVEVTLNGQDLQVKGSKGVLSLSLHELVEAKQEGETLVFTPRQNTQAAWMQTGTARALANNVVKGVSAGFERKLQLIGVGYKAAAKGKVLNLALGFSHPIDYELPEGVTAETPTATEIILKSANKQLLGQVAANVRAFRAPEPYKGKGVRYADEVVLRKEAKKK
ncbi:MAG TPA: 50S ribosomal protein L6 [Agitococcus sp.]|uniref:50S ribosomal protein L6 n=1 Tax=uncultured Agitococcus sp. TaxID=1506599 RepID=UPI002616DB28|nr:50S ribosomal protein L6 [uncultured Agitococcus sp.]HMU86121.1 50S ribosomal protein L6 [Agitococcus sp.]HMX98491.1 50S ribosomal protein L6 [Agitococcus sp.]HMY27775.1 50S ribosomal protein L6 [Agitococcus sp.]HNA19922.1 50S ribosomal protein L6 [Agitococcus sp.]HNC02017.1 50S ribosomal protein L6 [Agitococcus sp.]